jgi:hypothetical protein
MPHVSYSTFLHTRVWLLGTAAPGGGCARDLSVLGVEVVCAQCSCLRVSVRARVRLRLCVKKEVVCVAVRTLVLSGR